MGILDKILPKRLREGRGTAPSYQTFTDYAPAFTSYDGGVYEQELTRAAIERFAVACSKLKPEHMGTAKAQTSRIFDTAPNPWMTWPKFLARVATALECENTAYVVPGYAGDMQTVAELWPLVPSACELVDVGGEPWLRFSLLSGETASIELTSACVLTRFQYRSDVFGSEGCLNPTMQLIHAQQQAQESAIKNTATIRFLAAVEGQVAPEDLKKKRDDFYKANLTAENDSGLMAYDATFRDIRQIDPKSYVIDPVEMERIERNVCTYFGTNMKVLTNEFDEAAWAAYYEGKVEPFAVQLGQGLTQMLYTRREQVTGNRVMFSSKRLEYASTDSKRNMIRDMLDRGVITINDAREILQMSPVEGGDVRVIRGEYVNADSVSTVQDGPEPEEGPGPEPGQEAPGGEEEEDAVQAERA